MRQEASGVLVYTVTEYLQILNDTLRAIADGNRIAVEGEVSSFGISQGKWVRFDLKDGNGLINCFTVVERLQVQLEDGMQVRVTGYPKVYEKYGKLSLVIQSIEPVGEGALKRAYELLLKKLSEEGLFDVTRKRSIPRFPERIGLIASRESAACGDFLRILKNRWCGVAVELCHVQVQGTDAVKQIVGAFHTFAAMKQPPEIIVLTRGGGSLEDLAAFNSEAVARAIHRCPVPVVVGVGHERDTTIADFVADIRASTPTNAAEMVVPDRRDILRELQGNCIQQQQLLQRVVQQRERNVLHTITVMEARVRGLLRGMEQAVHAFDFAMKKFSLFVHASSEKIASMVRMLKSLDPQAVVKRGYAIVYDSKRKIVTDPHGVDAGTTLAIHLRGGILPVVATPSKGEQPSLF